MNLHFSKYTIAIFLAILAALCASLITPLSSLCLGSTGPMTNVGFMNLSVGIVCLIAILFVRKKSISDPERHIRKSDIPTLILMNVSDFLGSVFLMIGLTMASSTAASLMLNFEIVAAAVLAVVFLKEKVSKTVWIAVTLITLGCITISSGNPQQLFASPGLLLVLLTCVCWAFGNILKKKVAMRNTTEILAVRGFSVGIAGIILMFICGEGIPSIQTMLLLSLIGFITYGLGNGFLILSQRELSGAKSTTIVGINPFLSAVWSLLIFHETPTLSFWIGLLLLIPGFYMATSTKEYEPERLEPAESIDIDSRFLRDDTFFELRNYLTSLGFITIAVFSLLSILGNLQNFMDLGSLVPYQFEIGLSVWGFLIIIGILLLIIRKRNLAGITFLLFGILASIQAFFDNNACIMLTLGIFALILSVLFLLDASRKKYIFFILFLLEGLIFTTRTVDGLETVYLVLTGICIGFVLYLCLAASNLLPKMPGTKMVTSDEVFNFRRCGSMLGYMILALGFIPWSLVYIFGDIAVSVEDCTLLTMICAIYLFITSLLLMFIGRVRFTSALFLCMSFVFWISAFISGNAFYVIGIILLIFGLFSICRKRSFLLVALMLILFGISAFSSITVTGQVELYLSQVLLNVIPSLIAVYLAAALFSPRNRLPLF